MKTRKKSQYEWALDLDRWWFGMGAPETLAVLRIVYGALSFLLLAFLLPKFDIWFTESGLVPVATSDVWGNLEFSIGLLRGVSSRPVTLSFYYLMMLSSLCMAFGVYSRWSTFLTWLGMLSLHNRNPFILCGGDMTVRVVLFYLIWADTGAAYTVDSLWRKIKLPASIPLWPQRLICFQVSVTYLSSVWHKLLSETWREGSVLYYAWSYPDYHGFWLPQWMTHPPTSTVLSYFSLLIEMGLGVLPYFKSTRKYIIFLGVALHLMIDYSMVIPLFSYATIGMYLAFYDGEEIARGLECIRGKFLRRSVAN